MQDPHADEAAHVAAWNRRSAPAAGMVMVPLPLLETAIEQALQMAAMLWPQDHYECGPAQYVSELQSLLTAAREGK